MHGAMDYPRPRNPKPPPTDPSDDHQDSAIPLVVGETIGEAFILTYRMERACAMQLQFQQSGAEFNPIDDGVVRAAIARGGAVSDRTDPKTLEWMALLRKLDRIDPSYKE
jgi:hypothetical protein